MAGVAVFIPTTSKLVAIISLLEEDEDVGRSTICINKTTKQAGIASAYNDFVKKPTGLVHRLFGKVPYLVYRLDVSGPIEAGSSWQLPVLIAHALRAASNQLNYDHRHSAEVVWATGEVNTVDYSILPVDHITEKLRSSREIFEFSIKSGQMLRVILPVDNAKDIDVENAKWLEARNINVNLVGTIDEVFKILSLPPIPRAASKVLPLETSSQSDVIIKRSFQRSEQESKNTSDNYGLSEKVSRYLGIFLLISCATIVLVVAAKEVFNERENRSSMGSAVNNAETFSKDDIDSINCDEEPNLRSLGTRNPTTVIMRNSSAYVKKVFWLDFDGNRKLYATLESGQEFNVRTYISHPWIVTNARDECQGIYMPAAKPESISLR